MSVLLVECPTCKAPAGTECDGKGGTHAMRAMKLRDDFLMDSENDRTLGDFLDHYDFLKKENVQLQKKLAEIRVACDPSDDSPGGSRTHAEAVAEIRRVIAGEPLPEPPDPWRGLHARRTS